MRFLIPFLVINACNAPGVIYPSRIPFINIPCEDTGGCVLEILEVPYTRSESTTFAIQNTGLAVLEVSIVSSSPLFKVTPQSQNIDSNKEILVTVEYSPDGFEPHSTELTVTHNASGPALELEVFGTTDLDADDDGYDHSDAPGGDDCNDNNASINPGAEEIWYDGVDQNCDGWSDFDADGDGYDVPQNGGEDCDDTRYDVNPGAYDDPMTPEDENCDGEPD